MRQREDDRLETPRPATPPACDAWFPVVLPHLGEALADPLALERLRPLARRLPGDAMAALEAPLAAGRSGVDFSLRITQRSQARRVAERFFFPCFPVSLLDGEKEEAAPVSSLWLEFDFSREAGLYPVPVLCAGLRDRVAPDWVAGWLLPRLCGRPLAERQRGLVELCCQAIPPEARLLYAFSLLARGRGEVRLEILGLDAEGILRYLRETAPHTEAAVSEILPLFAGTERLHVSLDIGEQISSRVGVEGSFQRLPHREPGWQELFGRLVAAGLCSPEKRDAVFAWPGHDSFRNGLFCVRSLSHVKVVSCSGRQPEAKVYLLFTPFRKQPVPGER